VLVLEGDASAMYTVQALWTMARESLPVVVLIFANRAYRIPQGERVGVGATISGDKATAMLSLGQPAPDWVALARGHGLPGVRVDTNEALAKALCDGFASGGPRLIEALLQPGDPRRCMPPPIGVDPRPDGPVGDGMELAWSVTIS
jgi:acetolactate synthase-1/2/3 large subunit